MKILPVGLQAHLDTGATTLCWCWKLVRKDGLVRGYTDHDRALEFDGVVFEASTGFTASEIKSSIGLNVDDLEVDSVLSSESLNEDDLVAGLFDDASVEIYRVNWQDVVQRVLFRKGNIGEIKRGASAFTAEIRGLAHYLQQPKGRVYQFSCDAVLGDGQCKFDLESVGFRATGTVLNVFDKRRFEVSDLESFEQDWFSNGLLTWGSGANSGQSIEVKSHRISGENVLIELWLPMKGDVLVSDQFTIFAGCDKQFSTCHLKFQNSVNFRGFPHIPGNDFVVSYPNTDDPDNDGRSFFS